VASKLGGSIWTAKPSPSLESLTALRAGCQPPAVTRPVCFETGGPATSCGTLTPKQMVLPVPPCRKDLLREQRGFSGRP